MDETDRRLLALLQENADLPSKSLAEKVNRSASSVERRIARLKRDGVIERIVAVVDRKAVGRTLSVLVELEIQNEHRQSIDQFRRWIENEPNVQSCWYVTGDVDFVLMVAVRDLDEYNAFIDRLMSEQQAFVRKYKSLIALKTFKNGWDVSVDA